MRSILLLVSVFLLFIVSVAAENITSLEKRGRRKTWTVQLTWYNGGSLNNPACGDKTPSSSAAIVAVASNGPWNCHDILLLSAKNHEGHVVSKKVKVVDACGDCRKMPAGHIDATTSVWTTFNKHLGVGVLHNIHVRRLKKGSSRRPH